MYYLSVLKSLSMNLNGNVLHRLTQSTENYGIDWMKHIPGIYDIQIKFKSLHKSSGKLTVITQHNGWNVTFWNSSLEMAYLKRIAFTKALRAYCSYYGSLPSEIISLSSLESAEFIGKLAELWVICLPKFWLHEIKQLWQRNRLCKPFTCQTKFGWNIYLKCLFSIFCLRTFTRLDY